MKFEKFTFNAFQENTYLVWDSSKECIIIDPGCSNEMENTLMDDFINNQGLKPVKVVNTHCHIDHILGNNFACSKYDIPLVIHSLDLPNFNSGKVVAEMYGLAYVPSPEPDQFLDDWKYLEFGNSKLELRFTPGHAPGHVCLIDHDEKWVIAGDTLFQLSIGRTDLPGGDHQSLLESIDQELFSLPDDYEVHAGHGPSTNIGFERKHNPYMLDFKRAS